MSAKIRDVKENTGDISAAAIKNVYDEALEAQQRLFVMRGQMEKLKGEQVHLQDFIMQMQDMNGLSYHGHHCWKVEKLN